MEYDKETYRNQSNKHGYLSVDHACPVCGTYTLERQVYGYEETIFCTQCSYSITRDV